MDAYPGLPSPGLIEAVPAAQELTRSHTYPGLPSPGLIEAHPGDASGRATCGPIRGSQAPASLKQATIRTTEMVSAYLSGAPKPRPH